MSAGETEEDANASHHSYNQVCSENGVWGRNSQQSPKSPKDNFPSLSDSMSLDKKSVKSTSSVARSGSNRWGVN